ncbi:hypothetical protein C7R54_17885 [Achromobacter aloeverae]|uniref:Glycosyltransferase RgtA/B/C/D-like domain-containing protein n=2 Tax=Achromobacter aloeverae TaxID=1750518 RepID=A0A4Q1HJP4_9BURK|nr:hypothetical protein C7R54_17885 [Achromobacter aloeverae]
MHDYLFYVSRMLSGGPGGLFVVQCFVLFYSASAICGHFARSGPMAAAMGVGLVALFFLFPTLAGTVIVLWKDVVVVSFSLAAIATWLSGVRRFQWWKFFCVFFFLIIAISLRYNALPLVLPFMLLTVINPAGRASDTRKRIGALAGAMLVLSVSYATTLWRLPDFKRLPPVGNLVGVINLWDLTGVSACENLNLLPEGLESGERIPAADFKRIFDSRHLNITFTNPIWQAHVPRWGVDASAIQAQWRTVIREHPLCYLKIRNAVFLEQFGLHRHQVFYPTHSGIDGNKFGLQLAYPARTSALVQDIVAWSNSPLRRIYLLHAVALVLAVIAVWINRWRYDLLFALGLGIIGFVGLLYFAAPAADARYVFPSGVFSALLAILALGRITMWIRAKRPVPTTEGENSSRRLS